MHIAFKVSSLTAYTNGAHLTLSTRLYWHTAAMPVFDHVALPLTGTLCSKLLWSLPSLQQLQSNLTALCMALTLCCHLYLGRIMREQLCAFRDGIATGRQSAR